MSFFLLINNYSSSLYYKFINDLLDKIIIIFFFICAYNKLQKHQTIIIHACLLMSILLVFFHKFVQRDWNNSIEWYTVFAYGASSMASQRCVAQRIMRGGFAHVTECATSHVDSIVMRSTAQKQFDGSHIFGRD